jgi:hypothetical protein
MQCEKCGGEMWDNTVNKKNPKGPDYKCKDTECGHAVWLPKPGKVNKSVPPGLVQTKQNGTLEEVKIKAMVLAYAKDIEVAKINSGIGTPESIKEVIASFNELWQAIK